MNLEDVKAKATKEEVVADNWIERHPKATLAIGVFLILAVIVAGLALA